MELKCLSFNIKLTKIFKVTFCTNYETFTDIVPNFRKISLTHIPQSTRTYIHTYIHTHTYTYPKHSNYLRWNIFKIAYPVFLLVYSNPVSSSRKFPHKAIIIVSLQQHDMLYGSMYDIYYCFKVSYIFYTRP